MKTIGAVIVLLLVPILAAAADERATLYVVNSGVMKQEVRDGDVPIVKIDRHHFMVVPVCAGRHIIHWNTDKHAAVFTAVPGETYYVRLGVSAGVGWTGGFAAEAELMTKEQGEYWITQVKEQTYKPLQPLQCQAPASPSGTRPGP